MNIGLIDEDKTKFPNLALMKISAYHKQKKDNIEFATIFSEYDIIYKSKVFTYSNEDITNYKSKEIIKGGTGYLDFKTLPNKIELLQPDLNLYNCEHAYGFTTRGCIRNCDFCIVPKKEGKIIPAGVISEMIQNKKSIILMDNNILANEHGIKQIEYLAENKIKVDFNQGLDARLIDKNIAKLLSRIKFLKALRISCDSIKMINYIFEAVKKLRWENVKPRKYFCYVMIRDLKESLEIIKFLKTLDLDIFAQPYRSYDDIEPSKELKNLARYVNHKAIFNSITFEEYNKKYNLTNNKNLLL